MKEENCSLHNDMNQRVTETETTLINHVTQSNSWRTALVGACIAILLQVIAFVYTYSGVVKTVEYTSNLLDHHMENYECFKKDTNKHVIEYETMWSSHAK